jgi:hypothetical protein
VPELLSEEWFEVLAAALEALSVPAGSAGEPEGPPTAASPDEPGVEPAAGPAPGHDGLALGQIVTGVPDDAGAAGVQAGEVRYTIVLGPEGSAFLVRNSIAPANVVLVEDWPTAGAIASGEVSIPDLLNAGRIKVRGDSRALVSAGELLARVAPHIAAALGTSNAP